MGRWCVYFFGLWLFIRWLCCWRNFKQFLFGLACFITLIALFYAEKTGAAGMRGKSSNTNGRPKRKIQFRRLRSAAGAG